MATKEFDCIAFKRDAAERIYDTVKAMSPDEELAYWRKREAALRSWLKDSPITTAMPIGTQQ